MKRDQCLVVLPLDEMSVGDVYPEGQELPLHCMVMPWFELSLHPKRTRIEQLDYKLKALARGIRQGGCDLVIEGRTFCGDNADVLVAVLRMDEWLKTLHTALLVFLASKRSAPYSLRYVGAGYRPHITELDREEISRDPYSPWGMVLIRRNRQGVKTVIREYQFAGPF